MLLEWCIMSITLKEFPYFRVLLINLLVYGMASLFITHVPFFIHSCICVSFEVENHHGLLHLVSSHKAII